MKIEGYQVVCYGLRVDPNQKHNPLKNVCRDCGLYSRSKRHTTEPSWRAYGFMSPNSYKCKIKELYGKKAFKNDFKDDKLRWDLLPLDLVEKIVEVYHMGSKKYGENTWQNLENGRERYLAAHLRHLCAWRKGEQIDSESGLNHLQHCIWNLMAVLYYDLNQGKDDKH